MQAAPGDWALCGGGFGVPERGPVPQGEVAGAIHLSSEQADLAKKGVSVLRNKVQIDRSGQQLQSDTARYDQAAGTLEASGAVRYWEESIYLTGDHAHMDLEADETVIDNANFSLIDEHGRGQAQQITLSGSDLVLLKDARYTTCDPDQEAWVLKAKDLHINKLTDTGVARHVRVEFKGVPIFYSPYLSFPLSDTRKTGFLTPSFRLSGNAGAEVQLPYYWNIAPNRDATLRVRATGQRGVVLGGKYRYLSQDWGQGAAGLEWLPDDRERGGGRALFNFQHSAAFAGRWNTNLNLNHVTDKDYFEDLGTSLDVASTQFLQRRANLSYSGDRFSVSGLLDSYQTVDKTIPGADRPYERLPQIQFSTHFPEHNRRLNFGLYGEFVAFDREASVTGSRVDLRPTLRYPVRGSAYFIEPSVSLHHTLYSLDDQTAGKDDSPSRTLPVVSLDSGLFLERDLSLGNGSYVQTLEPRIYYLMVPFDDQSDLPVFDTGAHSFNFSQLFRENRFSGADRLGDAHQITLALTSRLLEDDGDELLRASIGQIRFLRDRKVGLPAETVDTNDGSALVAELAGKVGNGWRLQAGMQYDPHEGRTDKNTISVRYQPDSARVLNLSYRFVRGSTEQTDLSLHWPISGSWNAVGRWNYALAKGRSLETFGGIEYDSCCWAFRAVGRRYLTNTAGDYTNAIFFQLELKGLAGLGKKTEHLLERSIPGFHNTF